MWFVDETYVKVAGRWTHLYRAIDQHGQVVDVLVCERRDATAARAFFKRALTSGPAPAEVTTDRAPVYPRVVDDLLPTARHVTEQHTNTGVETDHGRLKARLRPTRGLKTLRSLRVVRPGTRSCRTYAADTTNYPPPCRSTSESAPRSTTSRAVSSRQPRAAEAGSAAPPDRSTQQSRRRCPHRRVGRRSRAAKARSRRLVLPTGLLLARVEHRGSKPRSA
jgi:hypothetical protein